MTNSEKKVSEEIELLKFNPDAIKDFTPEELKQSEEWLSDCNKILLKRLKEDELKTVLDIANRISLDEV